MTEPDESRLWKYQELPSEFYVMANEIDIAAKQQLRTCQKLAEYLAKQKPKNPKEFEQNEWLKDFVLKTADLNDKTISLLDYIKTKVQDIADDTTALMEGAILKATLRDQSEKILQTMKERDEAVTKYYEIRKTIIGLRKETA